MCMKKYTYKTSYVSSEAIAEVKSAELSFYLLLLISKLDSWYMQHPQDQAALLTSK